MSHGGWDTSGLGEKGGGTRCSRVEGKCQGWTERHTARPWGIPEWENGGEGGVTQTSTVPGLCHIIGVCSWASQELGSVLS